MVDILIYMNISPSFEGISSSVSTCNILNHKMAKWHFMLQRINPNEVLWRLFQMRLPRIIGFKAKKT